MIYQHFRAAYRCLRQSCCTLERGKKFQIKIRDHFLSRVLLSRKLPKAENNTFVRDDRAGGCQSPFNRENLPNFMRSRSQADAFLERRTAGTPLHYSHDHC